MLILKVSFEGASRRVAINPNKIKYLEQTKEATYVWIEGEENAFVTRESFDSVCRQVWASLYGVLTSRPC